MKLIQVAVKQADSERDEYRQNKGERVARFNAIEKIIIIGQQHER